MTRLLPQVITAQMALNYAAFLEEHNFFEDSFRVYEQAVALFGFPQVNMVYFAFPHVGAAY
jgi:pre-mRNA-splicing factor SYF1